MNMHKPQARMAAKVNKLTSKTRKVAPKGFGPILTKVARKVGRATTPSAGKTTTTSKTSKGGAKPKPARMFAMGMKKGAGAKTGTLAVTGEGEIKVRPDIAILGVNVMTRAATAQEAVQRNAEKMNAVIDALRDMGIKPVDMQTVGYDVIPVLDQDEKSSTYGKILEYRVVSQLRVRADVEQAGEVIDNAISAGANMTTGIRYGLRDEANVRSRALTDAVRNARRDADVVAKSLGVKIRDTDNVEINMGGIPIFFREMALPKASNMSTPIEPGTIEIRASVRIVYRTT